MNLPQWQNAPQQIPPARQGRDPRVPFGTPTSNTLNTPTQIEAYQQPRGGAARSILIGVLALAVVAAVLLGLQSLGSSQGGTAGVPSNVAPSAGMSSLGAEESKAPFEANGGGTFELLSSAWTSDNTVKVQVRITLNEGSASFDIYLLSSKTMKSYQPTNSPSMRVRSGQPTEIALEFAAPKEMSTIVLSTENGNGRGLAALKVTP